MPQLRRMVLGPDYSLDDLRTDVARAVEALPAGAPSPVARVIRPEPVVRRFRGLDIPGRNPMMAG
ncbi:hypothetical protein ACWY4P_48940 [Streptomyces sp. LZ34]